MNLAWIIPGNFTTKKETIWSSRARTRAGRQHAHASPQTTRAAFKDTQNPAVLHTSYKENHMPCKYRLLNWTYDVISLLCLKGYCLWFCHSQLRSLIADFCFHFRSRPPSFSLSHPLSLNPFLAFYLFLTLIILFSLTVIRYLVLFNCIICT